MLYYLRKGKNANAKKTCAVYGEGAATDQTCQKCFMKIHAGDSSMDDAPWSGRPAEVDSDQIETLAENNQCYTTLEIADILKISTSIKLLVKMKICLLFYRKKLNGLFGQSNTYVGKGTHKLCIIVHADIQRETVNFMRFGVVSGIYNFFP